MQRRNFIMTVLSTLAGWLLRVDGEGGPHGASTAPEAEQSVGSRGPSAHPQPPATDPDIMFEVTALGKGSYAPVLVTCNAEQWADIHGTIQECGGLNLRVKLARVHGVIEGLIRKIKRGEVVSIPTKLWTPLSKLGQTYAEFIASCDLCSVRSEAVIMADIVRCPDTQTCIYCNENRVEYELHPNQSSTTEGGWTKASKGLPMCSKCVPHVCSTFGHPAARIADPGGTVTRMLTAEDRKYIDERTS